MLSDSLLWVCCDSSEQRHILIETNEKKIWTRIFCWLTVRSTGGVNMMPSPLPPTTTVVLTEMHWQKWAHFSLLLLTCKLRLSSFLHAMSTDAGPTGTGIKWSNRYAVKVSQWSLVHLLSKFPWHSCWACMYSCWTAFETSQHILRTALTQRQLGEKIGLLLILRFSIWSLTDNHVERIIWMYWAKCIMWCFSEIHSTRCSNYTKYIFPVLKLFLQLLQVLQKHCRLWKYFMKRKGKCFI